MAAAAKMSDLEYMRSKMVGNLDDDDDEDDEEEEGGEEGEEEEAEEAESDEDMEEEEADAAAADATAGELQPQLPMVTRSSSAITTASLSATCLTTLRRRTSRIHLPRTARSRRFVCRWTATRRGKGFAYVRYVNGEHAVAALSALDGTIFQGRLIHLLPSRPFPAKSGSKKGRRREAARRPVQGEEGGATERRPQTTVRTGTRYLFARRLLATRWRSVTASANPSSSTSGRAVMARRLLSSSLRARLTSYSSRRIGWPRMACRWRRCSRR